MNRITKFIKNNIFSIIILIVIIVVLIFQIYTISEIGTNNKNDNRINVIAEIGESYDSESIEQIKLMIKIDKNTSIDLSRTDVKYINTYGTIDLKYGGYINYSAGEEDNIDMYGKLFGISDVVDNDNSIRSNSLMNSEYDRGSIHINTDNIVSGLEEGEKATVKITTESGKTTIVKLQAPSDIDNNEDYLLNKLN